MSKKSLISARSVLSARWSLAIPFLTFVFSSTVWAQPDDSYTWNTTMSFNGTGTLAVSSTTYGVTGAPDPVLTVSMWGPGVNTANFPDNNNNYEIGSAFNNTTANITIPESAAGYKNPFSVTQPLASGSPTGSDPGLTLTAPQTTLPGDPSSAPFYGLFPPPAGQVYNGDVTIPDEQGTDDFEGAPREAEHSFYYPNPAGPSTLFVAFTGPVTLKLGPNPVLTMTPDLNTGDDYYTYRYADSVLDFTATVGGNDPTIDFLGIVTITTVVAPSEQGQSVPDSSPGMVGVLVLLSICALGARQMRSEYRC